MEVLLSSEENAGIESVTPWKSSMKSIVSNDIHLAALAKNGDDWAFLGFPGKAKFTSIRTYDNMTNELALEINGHKIAFKKVDTPANTDVISISVEESDIVMELENGDYLPLKN